MFDRLFNILKTELNDALDTRKNKDGYDEYPNVDSEYDKLFGTNFSQNQQSSSNWEAEFEKEFQQKYGHQHQNHTPPPPNAHEKQYYDALEVPMGASFEQIKASYRSLIKKYHPDRFATEPDKQKKAIELTQNLNVAFNYFEKKFGK